MSSGQWERGTTCILPHWAQGIPKLKEVSFPHETLVTISFRTNKEAIAAKLPPGLKPLGEPTINFRFRYSTGVNWATGGIQPMVGVSTPVVFEGRERIEGVHWLALWEGDPMMVMLGREVMGVAKLCADVIPQPDVEGCWRAVVSERGRPMLEVKFSNPKPVTEAELAQFKEAGKRVSVLGYKFLPDPSDDAVETQYVTHYPHQFFIESAWRGEGAIKFFTTEPETHVWSHHVIEGLAAMPRYEQISATMTQGAGLLHMGAGRRLT